MPELSKLPPLGKLRNQSATKSQREPKAPPVLPLIVWHVPTGVVLCTWSPSLNATSTGWDCGVGFHAETTDDGGMVTKTRKPPATGHTFTEDCVIVPAL